MLLDSETVFNNLPENSSDDTIVNVALIALHENDMGEGYIFQSLRNRFDKSVMKRIINRMETHNLITVRRGEYEDTYEHNILITTHGTSIASNGGWFAYMKSLKTESSWIDEVLRDSKESYISLCRDTPEEYQRALKTALRLNLIEEITNNSYSLAKEGENAMDLGGFDEWKKDREQKRNNEWRPSIVTGNNAIIGNNNSGVIQGQEGALINTGSNVHIDSNMKIKKGNFEDLAQKLKDNHVSQQDIEELKSILESDSPNKGKRIFGDKTNVWISKMISKSLEGTWQIGVGAAGGLLVEVIKTFYGWQ